MNTEDDFASGRSSLMAGVNGHGHGGGAMHNDNIELFSFNEDGDPQSAEATRLA